MPFFFESIFPVFFFLLFSAFFVMFFFVLGKSIRESVKNNRSPRLTVEARVVTKRMQNGYYRARGISALSGRARRRSAADANERLFENIRPVCCKRIVKPLDFRRRIWYTHRVECMRRGECM